MESKEKSRIVIVGGVAGGASAAARARRCNASAEITVLEKGPTVSFANCGLPYHLGGEIEKREKLIVATPELFWDRFRIRIRTGHLVEKIDRQAKTITGTADGQEFKLPYDRLILATGSTPIVPPFARQEADNLFQLWTLEDMDRILALLKGRPCKKATIVGAGFVGLEIVEQLVRRNIAVNLVELAPQVLRTLDPEMAQLIERELQKVGVKVHLNCGLDSLLINKKRVTAAKLDCGQTIATDLVIVGVGVRPRTELAEDCGLEIGGTKGVTVNEYCQTSDPSIYAVGDIAQYPNGTLNDPIRIPLGGPANKAGRIAGAHAAGAPTEPMPRVLATSVVRVFEMAAASTGLNESACDKAGLEYRVATVQAAHHASYFPGAKTLTLKLIYGPDGRVLGAQAVGAGGTDKRIDVIASCMHFGGSVDDLAALDLCYAPPFGAAKDPVHIAAFVAQNDLKALPELMAIDADLVGWQIVDVRNEPEFEKLPPIEGARCIPLDQLHERLEELDPSKPTVTVCHSGKRAHVAACLLMGRGFEQVRNLNGGMSVRKLYQLASGAEESVPG